MKKLIVTAAFLLVANIGIAQTQAFKDDVKRLINVSANMGSAQLEAGKKQILPMIPAEKHEAFSKEFDGLMAGYMADVEKFYLAEFTHEEVKQILKFHDSPVGKKVAQKTVVLSERMMSQMQEMGMKVQEIMMKYMQ